MKLASIVAAGLVWSVAIAATASAQPILNRVEQFLRQQLGEGATLTPVAPDSNEQGYLGLNVDDRQDLGRGVRITGVTPGGPASLGGLLVGDLITGIDGQPVRLMGDMSQALVGKRPDDKVAITASRQGAEQTFEVALGRRAESRLIDRITAELPAPSAPGQGTVLNLPPPPRPRLGVSTLPVDENARLQNNLAAPLGAVVDSVTKNSPAERAGIPKGAVITAVDRQPIRTPQELAAAIARAGDRVELTYIESGVPKHHLVALVEQLPPAAEPTLELRGRPIDSPAEPTPTTAPTLAPPPPDAATVEALNARIRELEGRIEKLEAALGERSKDPK
ncbi:MAG: PDZ domain-containing protein [Pirellulales bacterium]